MCSGAACGVNKRLCADQHFYNPREARLDKGKEILKVDRTVEIVWKKELVCQPQGLSYVSHILQLSVVLLSTARWLLCNCAQGLFWKGAEGHAQVSQPARLLPTALGQGTCPDL